MPYKSRGYIVQIRCSIQKRETLIRVDGSHVVQCVHLLVTHADDQVVFLRGRHLVLDDLLICYGLGFYLIVSDPQFLRRTLDTVQSQVIERVAAQSRLCKDDADVSCALSCGFPIGG